MAFQNIISVSGSITVKARTEEILKKKLEKQKVRVTKLGLVAEEGTLTVTGKDAK